MIWAVGERPAQSGRWRGYESAPPTSTSVNLAPMPADAGRYGPKAQMEEALQAWRHVARNAECKAPPSVRRRSIPLGQVRIGFRPPDHRSSPPFLDQLGCGKPRAPIADPAIELSLRDRRADPACCAPRPVASYCPAPSAVGRMQLIPSAFAAPRFGRAGGRLGDEFRTGAPWRPKKLDYGGRCEE
jgi:hypothetical protein